MQLLWCFGLGNRFEHMVDLGQLPAEPWNPLIIFNVMNLPFGWGFQPGVETLLVICWVVLATGITSLLGLATNASLVVFAATSVYLQAFIYSFGDHHHPEAVMMIALSALALSPCGRVLSLDAWLRRRLAGATPPSLTEVTSEYAAWPIRLLQWFFVLMYFSAVYSKLVFSGFDWANGYTLQYYLVEDGLRHESPLTIWLSQFHVLILILQIGVLVFQGTFALPVLFPQLRWIYVPVGLALHIGIYLTLTAPFFTWIALYVIFIPWAAALRRYRGLNTSAASPQPA